MKSNYQKTLLSVEYKNCASRLFSHSHIFHQLIYISEGSVDIDIDGKMYEAHAPSVVVVSSFEKHAFDSRGKSYGRYCLSISTDVFDKGRPISDLLGFLRQRGSDFSHVIDVKSCESALRPILDELVGEFGSDEAFADLRRDLLFYELLVLLHRKIPQIRAGSARGDSLMTEIQNYVEENCSENITIAQIAKAYGISRSKLSHSFREVTGYPVVEYVTMCRMTKARNLLSETDLPVTQIATTVGYCNVTNFSRMFRLKNNCTPSEYRAGARSYKPLSGGV